jgi:hypothetical protein
VIHAFLVSVLNRAAYVRPLAALYPEIATAFRGAFVQKKMYCFVEGSAGQLRKGNIKSSAMTAKAFDQGQSFMQIEGNLLSFQAISRADTTIDYGTIQCQVR